MFLGLNILNIFYRIDSLSVGDDEQHFLSLRFDPFKVKGVEKHLEYSESSEETASNLQTGSQSYERILVIT